MRPIKFRAWDKEEKKMFVPIKLEWIGRQFAIAGCELMQFTGLIDKKGKEIYEGDIVKEYGRISEIVYSSPTFRQFSKKTNKVMATSIAGNIVYEIEVIGNIYENPELLESKENS